MQGVTTALLASVSVGVLSAHATDATWTGPGAEWATGTNWSSSPTVPDNTATFTNNAAPTSLTISGINTISTIQFNAGAPAYTFTVPLSIFTITGTGIVNNSAFALNFITNGSIVDFKNSSTAGNATIFNIGAVGSLLRFNNNSTAGNATIINNVFNTVQFMNNSTAGNAQLIAAGGIVNFSTTTGPLNDNKITAGSIAGAGKYMLGLNALTVGSNDLSTAVSGVISGAGGSLVKLGAGTMSLSGINTYTGGTTISGGTLALTGAGTLGAITGSTTVNGGSLDLGTTSQTQNGGVTLTSGTIANGTLSSSIDFAMQSGTVSATLAGGSGLVKTTAGVVTLSGNNTYTGATTVNGGTLAVNGSILSSTGVTVNANSTLAGTGTVSNTTVNNGGTLAPGSGAAGTSLAVSGNLAFQSAAFYLIQVGQTSASSTNVTGVATLAGATVNAAFAPGSYMARQYIVLTANGGVAGTFGALGNTNLPPNITDTLTYDATHAYLNVALAFGGGLNTNQQLVGNALTSFFNTTGGIPIVFAALSPAGLKQASGELATGSQQTTFDAMNQFLSLMTDPFVTGRGDPASAGGGATGYADDQRLAYAAKRNPNDALAAVYRKAPVAVDPFAQRWSVWAAGYGGSQTTNGNATLGSNNTSSNLYGTAVGADYRLSPNTLAGFALAGGGTNFSVTNGLGSGRSDLFQAGAFVRHTMGQSYFTAALAYGWQDVTTDRTVTIAGIDRLRAQFNANAFSGRVEGGYRFVAPWIGGIGITPYAAAQFTTFDLPAYAEGVVSGVNTFTLAYGAKSVTAQRGEIGVRTDKSWAMPIAILTLRGRLAWAYDANTDRNIAATFQTLPGASFVVNGAAQSHDKALTTASAEMKWINGWSAAATFEGEFSDVSRSYAGKGVIRYAW